MKQLTTFILVFILVLAVFAQDKQLPDAQTSLVDTERAFAKLAVDRSVNESFIAYFADEGIGFNPHPHKVRETLSRVPAPTKRSPIVLNWAPIYGDISQAGDLGYNTGPTVVEDHGPQKRPTRHGLFFSVWKKQSDGSWRVVLDIGADTPSAVASLDTPFVAARRSETKRNAEQVNVEEEKAALLKVEREFLQAAGSSNAGQTYKNYLSDDARIHRPGMMPAVGKDMWRDWVAGQSNTLTGEPMKADVSRSGDLGYVYGSYALSGAKPEKGYYARVWRKENDRNWKIVLDTLIKLPILDTEAALNAEGYRLLQNKKTKEAIEIFQKAVNKYPDSANAYDSLSDAYEADGNKALAIEFAQKALEVLAKDPNMTEELKGRVRDSANDKLKRLRGQ